MFNDIFSRFDRIADARGLEKIKMIGDSYMVAAGLPVPVADHTARAAHMALDMNEAMDRFNEESSHKLKVRIGVDTGAAVAGIIGKRKFLYDLWGDVINTASRMESHGVAGRIQITDATRERLGEPFLLEERGVISVKGKGEMHTWFLNQCLVAQVLLHSNRFASHGMSLQILAIAVLLLRFAPNPVGAKRFSV